MRRDTSHIDFIVKHNCAGSTVF